jgi:hypothetical protein
MLLNLYFCNVHTRILSIITLIPFIIILLENLNISAYGIYIILQQNGLLIKETNISFM